MTKPKYTGIELRGIIAVAALDVSARPGHDPETLAHAERHAKGGSVTAVLATAKRINNIRNTLPSYHPATLIVFADLLVRGLMSNGAPAGQFAGFVNHACKGARRMKSDPSKAHEITPEDIASAYATLGSTLFY